MYVHWLPSTGRQRSWHLTSPMTNRASGQLFSILSKRVHTERHCHVACIAIKHAECTAAYRLQLSSMADSTRAIKAALWAFLAFAFASWILSIVGLAGAGRLGRVADRALVNGSGNNSMPAVSSVLSTFSYLTTPAAMAAGLQRQCYSQPSIGQIFGNAGSTISQQSYFGSDLPFVGIRGEF